MSKKHSALAEVNYRLLLKRELKITTVKSDSFRFQTKVLILQKHVKVKKTLLKVEGLPG